MNKFDIVQDYLVDLLKSNGIVILEDNFSVLKGIHDSLLDLIMYFIDFNYYEEYEESLSDASYVKARLELPQLKFFIINKIHFNNGDYELTIKEKASIDKTLGWIFSGIGENIENSFEDFLLSNLEEHTPWINTKHGEEIKYINNKENRNET